MERCFRVLGGLILSVVALNVQAAPGMINPWHTAGHGSATWPSEEHSGLGLSSFPALEWGNTITAGNTSVILADGFSDLQDVSYARSLVGDIGLMPLAAVSVSQQIQFDASSTSQQAVDIRHDGGKQLVDLSTLPVPTAAWLFGPGMLGLVAVARRHPS